MGQNASVDFGFDQSKTGEKDNAPFAHDTLVATKITFAAPVAGAANVTTVPITVKDGHGNAVASPTPFLLWLSDAADGEGLTATTASGAVAAAASGGAVLGTLTSKMCLLCQTKDDGTFTLSITDSAKTGFYIAAAPLGFGGLTYVSGQLVTGSYGS